MIPSYEDLTPGIPDVLDSATVSQLALFLRADLPRRSEDGDRGRPNIGRQPGEALYACLRASGSGDLSASEPALLGVARDFSPRARQVGAGEIVVDVSGLGRLIGESPAIARELARSAAVAGVRAGIAVAPTQTAARLLAAASRSVGGETGSASDLAPLPVALLRPLETLPAAINHRDANRPYDVFARWGIATLGELAALPAADLASRLGRRGVALQRLARGLDPAPFVPDQDAPRFVGRLELEWPIEALEPLSFVFARLLDPLSAALERADRGAAAIRLELRLTDRSTDTRLLQLPAPMRDPRVLRTLLLLHLESTPPRGPADQAMIDVVTIELDPAPARITQFSLLRRALPSPETLSTLTARLSALVGESRVGSPVRLDTHQPGAFAMARFAPGPGHRGALEPDVPASAVLRRQRVPPAIRVRVERGRPVSVAASRRGQPQGMVVQAAGPWRSSGGWWGHSGAGGWGPRQGAEGGHSGAGGLGPRQGAEGGHPRSGASGPVPPKPRSGEGGWNRDEWDIALSDGAVCRIYQDRRTACWFLDGVYD